MSENDYSRRLELWEACQRIICREPQQGDPELVANAYLAENANDDLEPADFEWLVSQCERNTSTTHEADGSVWWECGCVSFECGHVDHEYGEVELIAVEWLVDGCDLPKTLEPRTRGDFRRLCRMANRTPPEPVPSQITEMTPDEVRRRLWRAVAERDRLREALTWAVGFIRCQHPNAYAEYEDMRNAAALVHGELSIWQGEFQRVSCRAEVAEHERDRLKAMLAQHGIPLPEGD